VSRLAIICISTVAVLVALVVGNAVARSEHVNGFAVASVDLAIAVGAWLLVVRTKRSVGGGGR
jgi:hypothetical protein